MTLCAVCGSRPRVPVAGAKALGVAQWPLLFQGAGIEVDRVRLH